MWSEEDRVGIKRHGEKRRNIANLGGKGFFFLKYVQSVVQM